MWITPKTDWTEEEYYNYTDWLRITGNLEHLKNIQEYRGPWYSMDVPEEINGYPTVTLLNNFETNLTNVRNWAIHSTPIVAYVWYPRLSVYYKKNPDYEDFNRWEDLELALYQIFRNELIAGTFRAGSNRMVQRFSRGRDLNLLTRRK